MTKRADAAPGRLAALLLLLVGLGGSALPAQQWSLGTDVHVRAATLVAQRLAAGAFDSVAAAVDPHVPPGVFSAGELRKIWDDLVAQNGTPLAFEPVKCVPVRWTHVVTFDARSQRKRLTLRVVVDDEGRLAGMFWGAAGQAAPPVPGPPAAYVDTAAFAERELALGADPWQLSATLSLPKGKGPFPAVVLVHGSGPHDRDETIGPNRPFLDLAHGLATRGIAVLRYDKRTWEYPGRLPPEAGLEEEVVADALAGLDTLRHVARVDPRAVFLLGHSLGGYMAPVIAQRDGHLAGAILLGANTGSVVELVIEQLRYQASLSPAANPELLALMATLDSLRAGQLTDHRNVMGAPVRYWRELDAVRPVEAARRISTPLLILQGGRDYQVPPRELAIWRRELGQRPRTSFRELPALNHLFMAGKGPSIPLEYFAFAHVDGEAVDAIARWLLQQAH